AVGGHSACGLTPAGTAYCWGSNQAAQLGNGTISDGTQPASETPTAVAGGITFRTISSGGAHTCGLTPGGQAYCWGLNTDAQIGVGPTGDSYCPGYSGGCRPTPVAVLTALRFDSISAGGSHTCGIAQGGGVYCWGGNWSGQLGRGGSSTANDSIPGLVMSSGQFVQITGGDTYNCARTASGSGSCWGSGYYGVLGNGLDAATLTPVAIDFSAGFGLLSAGGLVTCGLTAAASTPFCWGEN